MNKSLNYKRILTTTGIILLVGSISGIAIITADNSKQQKLATEYLLKDENRVLAKDTNVTVSVEKRQEVEANETKENGLRLPPKDESLPSSNFIRIKKLGINAPINIGEDSDQALDSGAWLAHDFNTPPGKLLNSKSEPIIIASHLYGSSSWSENFREDVSFKGLDTLTENDKIEIIWDQRMYEYTIKTGEINTEISNYKEDLILYTCNDLNESGLRVIKYAQLDKSNIKKS